jgi:uncharacterized protein (DUF433 family)
MSAGMGAPACGSGLGATDCPVPGASYDSGSGRRQMPMTTTAHRYIVRDPQILSGEPIVAGTRTPVRAIVELWRTGTPPESIPNALPHLTLAQVFDALSYYSDNQGEINAHIERNRVPDHLLH